MKKTKKDKRNLYDFEIENEKEKKIKKNRKSKKVNVKESNQIDPDNEIIIGVTTYPEAKVKNKKVSKTAKEKNTYNTQKKKVEAKKTTLPEKNVEKKKSKKIVKILKWTSLFCILIGIIVFAMLSPIFNVTEIIVNGNNKILSEQAIGLSGIDIGENIFRTSLTKAEKQIKQNGYVENVNIKRILPNKVEINIEERTTTFIAKFGNGYIYINNQGYMLEISNDKLDVPMILGISTPNSEVKEGNRLNKVDLKKLGTVLKIMATANVRNIGTLITTIDITNDNEYTLYFESEQKTAYLGDCSDLETRMLYLATILERERGIPGEIFVNINLNTDDAFFRESV